MKTNDGQGTGKPTSKIIEKRGDMPGFVAHSLFLDVKTPGQYKYNHPWRSPGGLAWLKSSSTHCYWRCVCHSRLIQAH